MIGHVYNNSVLSLVVKTLDWQETAKYPIIWDFPIMLKPGCRPSLGTKLFNFNLGWLRSRKFLLMIQMPKLTSQTQFGLKQNKCSGCKIHKNNFHIRFGTWRAQCLNQSISKVKIPCWARLKEQLSLFIFVLYLFRWQAVHVLTCSLVSESYLLVILIILIYDHMKEWLLVGCTSSCHLIANISWLWFSACGMMSCTIIKTLAQFFPWQTSWPVNEKYCGTPLIQQPSGC